MPRDTCPHVPRRGCHSRAAVTLPGGRPVEHFNIGTFLLLQSAAHEGHQARAERVAPTGPAFGALLATPCLAAYAYGTSASSTAHHRRLRRPGARRAPMTPHSPTAREMARRLLAREMSAVGEPAMVAAALQRACARVSANLRDSVGDDGRNALLARALARTESDHPVLKHIRTVNNGAIHLDGVVASADAHGVAPVTAAIEALLAALLDVLGRLIGEDMAMRLLDHDLPGPSRDGGTRTP
jgi:hypothetical protein